MVIVLSYLSVRISITGEFSDHTSYTVVWVALTRISRFRFDGTVSGDKMN
jgi:hypothetical protein